jgi:prevent-host-death family protein
MISPQQRGLFHAQRYKLVANWLAFMKRVGAFEAKTHLSRLLEEVEAGEQVLITRHGRGVARLVPVEPSAEQQRLEAVSRLRRFRVGKTLGDISLQELRDAGRRR